ncbi:hypothetical protein PSU4_50080 [Pseudonocardia sulfidoxydans NBRC 16205]|uniref:Uncharacterized protein n=2 Tax=Pseudonocardia sulfidoxydans TaxID=54011 RepID=A0A511DQM9_9PSEU|nr:hypothetical protein [Pseudonocardia sulfidoxydans]GEL26054.1 hypothetical protein PSU4_50080 [Pseudonocardia sulfidoxydans NBRC 16205]
MTDPGSEYWRRQAVQLEVYNGLLRIVEADPDRFTGLVGDNSGETMRLTIHAVDPTVRDDERIAAQVAQASKGDVEITFVDSRRSLRELTAVQADIIRQNPLQENGSRGIELWIDAAASTVCVRVADSAVDTMRRQFAHHGDGVTVVGNGSVDLSIRLGRHTGPREGWPVPSLAPDDAIGRPFEEVAALYRSEGFRVEIYHLEDPFGEEQSLDPDRVTLLVHDGKVHDATQS